MDAPDLCFWTSPSWWFPTYFLYSYTSSPCPGDSSFWAYSNRSDSMSLDSDVLWWKGCELRSQGRLKSLSDSSCIYIFFCGCLFDLIQIIGHSRVEFLFWISRLWISSTLWTGWSFGDILVYPAFTGWSLKIVHFLQGMEYNLYPNGLVLGAGESSFHCNTTSIHLRCTLCHKKANSRGVHVHGVFPFFYIQAPTAMILWSDTTWNGWLCGFRSPQSW